MTITTVADVNIFIQWKGTRACMDLTCFCGHLNHYDQLFLYFAQCSKCKTVFKLGTSVSVAVATPDQYDEWGVGKDIEPYDQEIDGP